MDWLDASSSIFIHLQRHLQRFPSQISLSEADTRSTLLLYVSATATVSTRWFGFYQACINIVCRMHVKDCAFSRLVLLLLLVIRTSTTHSGMINTMVFFIKTMIFWFFWFFWLISGFFGFFGIFGIFLFCKEIVYNHTKVVYLPTENNFTCPWK